MLPMSLPSVQKKLQEHGVHVSYITLKRRSQDGTLSAARRGRKFDFDVILRLLAPQGDALAPRSFRAPEGASAGAARPLKASRRSDASPYGAQGTPDDHPSAAIQERVMSELEGLPQASAQERFDFMVRIANQIDVLVSAVQRLEQAIAGLDAVRKMLMIKDDEARSSLRERLEAAHAQIESLRGGVGGGSALDVARMQASLARLVGMVERAPWLAN